jgi:hypothetical protein
VGLTLVVQPGDSVSALPIGVLNPRPAVRVGILGGAGSLVVLGGPLDLQRLADAFSEAAAQGEE